MRLGILHHVKSVRGNHVNNVRGKRNLIVCEPPSTGNSMKGIKLSLKSNESFKSKENLIQSLRSHLSLRRTSFIKYKE